MVVHFLSWFQSHSISAYLFSAFLKVCIASCKINTHNYIRCFKVIKYQRSRCDYYIFPGDFSLEKKSIYVFPHHITHINNLWFSVFLYLAGWGLILVESFIWEKERGDDSWRGWFMTTICDLWLIQPEVLMWERGWTPPHPLAFSEPPSSSSRGWLGQPRGKNMLYGKADNFQDDWFYFWPGPRENKLTKQRTAN